MGKDSDSIDHSSNNIDGYNLWAKSYDKYPNPTVACDDIHFSNFYKDLSGHSVLEIGCGTGRHTMKLIKMGLDVFGIDISSGMVEQLLYKCPKLKNKVVVGDFLTDSSMFDSFDRTQFQNILTSLVIEHFKSLDSFFEKCSELSSSGASLYISNIHPERTRTGIYAHFKTEDGQEVALSGYNHSDDEIFTSANKSGFKLMRSVSVLGDRELTGINQKWAKHELKPLIQLWHFVKVS